MDKRDEILKEAFSAYGEGTTSPTDAQKDKMLHNIMLEGQKKEPGRLQRLIFAYPWRTAFALSAIQTAAFSVIFGTRYANLLLGFFGG